MHGNSKIFSLTWVWMTLPYNIILISWIIFHTRCYVCVVYKTIARPSRHDETTTYGSPDSPLSKMDVITVGKYQMWMIIISVHVFIVFRMKQHVSFVMLRFLDVPVFLILFNCTSLCKVFKRFGCSFILESNPLKLIYVFILQHN